MFYYILTLQFHWVSPFLLAPDFSYSVHPIFASTPNPHPSPQNTYNRDAVELEKLQLTGE